MMTFDTFTSRHDGDGDGGNKLTSLNKPRRRREPFIVKTLEKRKLSPPPPLVTATLTSILSKDHSFPAGQHFDKFEPELTGSVGEWHRN